MPAAPSLTVLDVFFSLAIKAIYHRNDPIMLGGTADAAAGPDEMARYRRG